VLWRFAGAGCATDSTLTPALRARPKRCSSTALQKLAHSECAGNWRHHLIRFGQSPKARSDHFTRFTMPPGSTVISLASAGIALVVTLPPGQRTCNSLAVKAPVITCTTLSWDQYPEPE
jgi:hypothetical protein